MALAPALAWALLPSVGRAQEIRTIARVIASSDISGRFAEPICRDGEHLRPSDGTRYATHLVRESRAADSPMVVDMGGLLAPHGVARFAAAEAPGEVASLVHALGYRALGLGVSDLAMPRASLVAVARALRRRQIPLIATNLRCDPESQEAQELCDALVDASDGISIHRVAGRSMAVLAFLPESTTRSIAPDRAEGLRFDEPLPAMARAVRRARARGAEIVVALWEPGGGGAGSVLDMAAEIPEDGRPDLVLVEGEGDHLLFARPATVRPVLSAAPRGGAIEVRIRESEELRSGYEMLAQPMREVEGGEEIPEPVRRFVQAIGPSYCERWGHPLPGGRLDRALDAQGLARIAAGAMREAAGADVALLNIEALDDTFSRPSGHSLTESDVFLGLQFDEPLVVADVPASYLAELAPRIEGARLLTPGLTWDGTAAKISGHALISNATYRVVTLRFLAGGGDGILRDLPEGGAWRPLESATLRQVVREVLEVEREGDPRDALPDPSQSLEWIFRADGSLTFSGASIQNPTNEMGEPLYSTSLLNLRSSLTFGFEVNLGLDAEAPDWKLENLGTLRYSTLWLPGSDGALGSFQESVDLIRVRSSLAWRGPRNELNEVYVPDLYVDVFIESELSPPDPSDRAYHWFLLRPSAGVRFRFTPELSLQLNGGLQTQALDPQAQILPGLGATLALKPWDLLRFEQRFMRLDANIDYFVSGVFDQNLQQLRGTVNLAFDLAGPLALTLGFQLFLQQDGNQEVGLAFNASAGLRVGYLARGSSIPEL